MGVLALRSPSYARSPLGRKEGPFLTSRVLAGRWCPSQISRPLTGLFSAGYKLAPYSGNWHKLALGSIMKMLQGLLLFVVSAVLIVGSTLTVIWSDAVGLGTAASNAKSVISAGTMIVGTLGLMLAGDKALMQQNFWNWVRNSGAQSKAMLTLANLVGIVFLAWLTIAWFSLREVKVYSDQAVVLVDIDDLLQPREIGLLSAGVERDVLVGMGERRLGFRIVGTETVSALEPFIVPRRGEAVAKLIFINTKGVRDVSDDVAPAIRVDPGFRSNTAGTRDDCVD